MNKFTKDNLDFIYSRLEMFISHTEYDYKYYIHLIYEAKEALQHIFDELRHEDQENECDKELYEKDFYKWVQTNVELLKFGNFKSIDIDNIVEELDSLRKDLKQELKERLSYLSAYLIEWKELPACRNNRLERTIKHHRKDIGILLKDCPSLKGEMHKHLPAIYEQAKFVLERNTDFIFEPSPTKCPYTIEQMLDEKFFPDGS